MPLQQIGDEKGGSVALGRIAGELVPVLHEFAAELADTALADVELSGHVLSAMTEGEGVDDLLIPQLVAGTPLRVVDPERHLIGHLD